MTKATAGGTLIPRLFWIGAGSDAVLIWILSLGLNAPSGPDHYAMGAGALIFHGLYLLVGLACALFLIRWRPWRILLTAAAWGAFAFLLIGVVDPSWW